MRAIFRYLIVPVLTLCGLVFAAGAAATAHHSFAPFDLTMEKTITGTVSKFEWTNPHSWIWVDVPNEKGGVDSWAVEGMSPNYLARRGWTKTTLKPGDKVTIAVRPLRSGENGGMFVRATLADGRVLTQSGQPKD
jgi:Family of unknown function (DUF6152)